MNGVVIKFLLAGDTCLKWIYSSQDLSTLLADYSLKTKKEYKNLKKWEIQDTCINTNYRKLAFSMIWLMEILRVCIEEQLWIKYNMIKHNIAKITKYHEYQRRPALMVHEFFDKNGSFGAVTCALCT